MYQNLDPLLHSQLRLAIISLLVSVEEAEFSFIKEKTNATSGNISVQIDKLQEADYIKIEKTFKGKYPLTKCSITKKGIQAFQNYVNALQQYIKPEK
jgi:predicted transcriptional regulator